MSVRYKPPRRLKRQVREPKYLVWLHTQPCVCAPWGGCNGRVEADHGSGHGMGQRNPDSMALPMCERHHREPGWTVLSPFRVWSKEQRREFIAAQRVIHRTRWMTVQLNDMADVPF